jgi:hypothetical protein
MPLKTDTTAFLSVKNEGLTLLLFLVLFHGEVFFLLT